MKHTQEDLVLAAHAPVTTVPMFGQYEPMEGVGHRFLVASNGLWLEARRPWCRVLWPMALQHQVRMPYGPLKEAVELAFDLPTWAIDRFLVDARAVYPLEVGAVLIWSATSKEMRYHRCETLLNTEASLRQKWPRLAQDEWVVMDLHSHGASDAYFSAKDRADTGSEFMIAAVVGCVRGEQPQTVASLFCCGLELPLIEAPLPY